MTSAEPRTSDDSERLEKKPTVSKQQRWWRWEHNPPQALVLLQDDPHLAVEDINEVNSGLSLI